MKLLTEQLDTRFACLQHKDSIFPIFGIPMKADISKAPEGLMKS